MVLFGAFGLLPPAAAQPGSVITVHPDPNHPILTPGFQAETDRRSHSRLTEGNRFELLENGVAALPRMKDLIRGARASVLITSMILADDAAGNEIARELIAAAGRGVDVRCLLDGLLADPRVVQRLRRGGCRVALYNHLFDFRRTGRQHQKMLVADFTRAISSGMNLAEEYLFATGRDHRFKDTAVLAEGPAAADMARGFFEAWLDLVPGDLAAQAYLGQLQDALAQLPPAAGPGGLARFINQESGAGEDHLTDYYVRVLDAARRQVLWHVNNVTPSQRLFEAAHRAARRGVRVVLVTNSARAFIARNGITGWFQHWVAAVLQRMLFFGTGIEIWELDTPLHSNAMTVDGVMASIGSYNFSVSSEKNFESTLVIYDPALVRAVEQMFQRDLGRARRRL
ncbi:MAG: cardiolipin synthase B [Planctomycetota bacterium]|nr:MAG: cardiolipin synthase B [Planctomycetota bacterium]